MVSQYYLENRESILQYRELNKEYFKEYRTLHKERYDEIHKISNQKYYIKNREKLLALAKVRTEKRSIERAKQREIKRIERETNPPKKPTYTSHRKRITYTQRKINEAIKQQEELDKKADIFREKLCKTHN